MIKFLEIIMTVGGGLILLVLLIILAIAIWMEV